MIKRRRHQINAGKARLSVRQQRWPCEQTAEYESRNLGREGGGPVLLCLLPPEAWSVGDQYRLYVSPTEEEMIVDRSAQWDGISVEVTLLQVEEDYLIEECGAPIRPYEGGGEHQNGPVPPQRSVGWEEVYTEPGNQRTWRRRREANKP